jgi:hypothetical protein
MENGYTPASAPPPPLPCSLVPTTTPYIRLPTSQDPLQTPTHPLQTPLHLLCTLAHPFPPPHMPPLTRSNAIETQTSHVTTVRPVRNRKAHLSKQDGLPRYIPPTSQGNTGTPQRPQAPSHHHSRAGRNPPPHAGSPRPTPRHSDLPNWHMPVPTAPFPLRLHHYLPHHLLDHQCCLPHPQLPLTLTTSPGSLNKQMQPHKYSQDWPGHSPDAQMPSGTLHTRPGEGGACARMCWEMPVHFLLGGGNL